MRSVRIDKFTLDDSHQPVFLAEIGTYFNQDIELAKQFVRKIKESGADIVKGEVLHSPEVCLAEGGDAAYMTFKEGNKAENYRALIERKVVRLEHYKEIFGLCRKIEIPFVLSVYDFEGADFALKEGACALKIATSNIVHAPLIRYVAKAVKKEGKPIIIDTGKSTLGEIAREMQWIRDTGCEDIIIEHAPAAAPNPLTEHHLRMIQTFKQVFDIPVGLSCHHSGDEMLYAAVALGANLIEKGVCDDPDKPDQDFYWSMAMSELGPVVQKCRNIYTALGKSMRHIPSPRKVPNDRMGLVAKTDVYPGEKIDYSTVGFAFPAKGVPVEDWDIVEGKKFSKAVKKGCVIKMGDVDAGED
ncbi:MAG: N-acetylneuraminate synthase family protein [Candidatus Omnitrophota bacterium]